MYGIVLLPEGHICKLYKFHIHECNENICNERKLVEKLKFAPTKLPIYQLLTITDY